MKTMKRLAEETRTTMGRRTVKRFLMAAVFVTAMATPGLAATNEMTFPVGWSVVSVPLSPDDPAPLAVFDELGASPHLYDYTTDTGHLRNPAHPGFRPVIPGRGYWVLFEQPTTISVTGELIDSSSAHDIDIEPGWNLIATPWPARVPWDDAYARVKKGANLQPLSGAVAQGWIEGDIHGFDPVTGSLITVPPNANGNLVPWQGFALFSTITGKLRLTVPPDNIPPEVEIIIPEERFTLNDADEIRSLTDVIGTVQDDNLAEWTLTYTSVELETTQLVATGGHNVLAGSVGQLDPTLLLNGVGELRLYAVDLAGNDAFDEHTIAIGGDNKLGNFRLTFIDLEVPFAGIPISVRRTYDTRRRGIPLDYGFGWQLEVSSAGKFLRNRAPGDGWDLTYSTGSCSLDPAVSHIVEVRFSDREFYRFSLDLKSFLWSGQECSCKGKFVQTGGIPGATLEDVYNPLPAGTSLITSQVAGQLVDQNDPLAGTYDPRTVRLTTLDGRQFYLMLAGGADPDGILRPRHLYKIVDRNDNTLQLTRAGQNLEVNWSNPGLPGADKTIQILRDAEGRVERLIDPDGYEIPYTYDLSGNLETVTDRTDNLTTFVYDTEHFLQEIIDPLDHKPIRPQFDDDGRLIAWLDAEGNATTFATDVLANAIDVTDREGDTTSYLYGSDGFLATVKQPREIETRYTYDLRGNVKTESQQIEPGVFVTTTYTYDYEEGGTTDNLIKVEDPLGNATTYEYDPSNPDKVTKITQPEENTTENVYDPVTGNLTQEIDGLGNVKEYTYTPLGKVETESLFFDPTDPSPEKGITTYGYDDYGNMTQRTDALGNVVDYTYDGNHRQRSEIVHRTVNPHADPANQVVVDEKTTMDYDRQGRLRLRTDPLGYTWEYVYDAAGRQQYQIDPLDRQTENVYDARNNLWKRVDPDGRYEEYLYDLEGRRNSVYDRHMTPDVRATHFLYDDLGRLVETTYLEDDGVSVQRVEYDDAGRLRERFDPRFTDLSVSTKMVYDDAGRLIETIDPYDKKTTNAYDANGRIISVTDAKQHVTSFVYDDRNRRIITYEHDGTCTPPACPNTRTVYDDAGRAIEQHDQNGKVTYYGYDPLGRLTSVTTPLGNTWEYGYDEVGNLITQTDANGHTTRFTYDANRRQLTRTLPEGQTEFFTYTKTGQRETRTDFNGVTTTYLYDDLDRLTDIDYPTNPTTADVQFTYTPTGRRKEMRDGIGTTSYEYDARDRLKSITDPFGQTISYGYDLAGNRTTLSPPSGTTTYTFDLMNRLETVHAPGDANPFVYEYDEDGMKAKLEYPNGVYTTWAYDQRHRLDKIETFNSSHQQLLLFDYTNDLAGNRIAVDEADGRHVDWGYDHDYKLTSEVINVPGDPVKTIEFAYDDVGNRMKRWDDGTLSQDFAYDGNDRIVTLNGTTFDFDANGNQLGDPLQGHVYGWDLENRLTSLTGPGLSMINSYNGQGMRLSSVLDGVETRYGVDPNTQYYRVLEEKSAGGLLNIAYSYGDAILRQSNGPFFLLGDALSSTRGVVNTSGALSETFSYEAFGTETEPHSNSSVSFRFGGEQLIPQSSLYNLRTRWYSPIHGRFLSLDRLGQQATSATHPYSYANDSPVRFVDPLGMFGSEASAISAASVNVSGALGYRLKVGAECCLTREVKRLARLTRIAPTGSYGQDLVDLIVDVFRYSVRSGIQANIHIADTAWTASPLQWTFDPGTLNGLRGTTLLGRSSREPKGVKISRLAVEVDASRGLPGWESVIDAIGHESRHAAERAPWYAWLKNVVVDPLTMYIFHEWWPNEIAAEADGALARYQWRLFVDSELCDECVRDLKAAGAWKPSYAGSCP